MSEIGVLALRGLIGGSLVVVFALISEVVKPKAFAGLFAAAPSVAVGSLAVTVVAESAAKARQSSIGMTVGGVAMAACCVLAVVAIPRLKAFWGSVLAVAGWLIAGMGLYWVELIGAR